MKSLWIEKNIKYDGSQLHSLNAYLNHGLLGDSIISYQGPCDVSVEHMVDGEDLLQNSEIRSENMLHFIIEKFQIELFSAVCLQRLMSDLCIQLLKEKAPDHSNLQNLIRKGDDIYLENKKLNISIATVSPSSTLIHYGINIESQNTPVPTLCLNDFKVYPPQFAEELMNRFINEVKSIQRATEKVKWVK